MSEGANVYAEAGEQVTCDRCGKIHATIVRRVMRNSLVDVTALVRPDGSHPKESEPIRRCECGGEYVRGGLSLHFADGWR